MTKYEKLLVLIQTVTDECIIAPGAPSGDGYPRVSVSGVRHKPHILVCRWTNGPRPPGLEAAHNCGVAMCVNPRHLRWATRSENQRDRRLHGTVSRTKARLTAEQAVAIRAEYAAGGATHRSLAAKYGVDHRSIGLIISGKSWS